MSLILHNPISYLINRKYKDRLFCLLFGSQEYKQYSLDLYNALNDSNYTNPDDLEITTINDVIYIKMRNDVSFLLSGHMALYEHQSTVCANMPLKGMIYCGQLYSKYLVSTKQNLHRRKLIRIPTPQYYVFYNGTETQPPIQVQHLSDAFMNEDFVKGDYEWTATVINISSAANPEILAKCEPLNGYQIFVEKVQRYSYNMSRRKAIDRAIDECIKEGILVDFFRAHKAEVRMSCLTEFDEESFRKGMADDWAEEKAEKDALIAQMEVDLADKDATLADRDAALADKDAALADRDAALADKDAALADKDARIKELEALLATK